MGFIATAFLLTIVICSSIWILTTHNLDFDSLRLNDMANSSVVSPQVLASIRLVFALIGLIVCVYVYYDKPIILNVYTRGGDYIKAAIVHAERFTTFTTISWAIQSIYYCMALLCSVDFLFMKSFMSSNLMVVTWILYEISFATAYLVTIIVTFVLIPGGKAKSVSVDVFFYPAPLCMHNLNVVFIITETLLNNLSFNIWHLPFVFLYGCSYILLSWYIFSTKGYLFYFFLDYDRKDAIPLHLGLLFAVALFFLLGYYISFLKDLHNPIINIVIILGTLCILKVRNT